MKPEITPEQFQENALSTAANRNGEKPTFAELLEIGAYNMHEAGEVGNLIKKHLLHGHPLDRLKLLEECGDVLWPIAVILYAAGIDMSAAMVANNVKLAIRYGGTRLSHKASMSREETDKLIRAQLELILQANDEARAQADALVPRGASIVEAMREVTREPPHVEQCASQALGHQCVFPKLHDGDHGCRVDNEDLIWTQAGEIKQMPSALAREARAMDKLRCGAKLSTPIAGAIRQCERNDAHGGKHWATVDGEVIRW